MDKELQTKLENLIWGAFVADAAAVGLHWIYDQERIYEIAVNAPEFLTPNASNYAGVQSFFAHQKTNIGDLSHYGHQMLVALRSLAKSKGEYHRETYEKEFQNAFGYGGSFTGYIDSHYTTKIIRSAQVIHS